MLEESVEFGSFRGEDREERGGGERPMSKQQTAEKKPRIRLDRPFLYFVRHNPTGFILHMGRFNPRVSTLN